MGLQEFGLGLSAAILFDATVVRALLVPALMKLLGEWNWYLPRWLEWLPRVNFEGRVEGGEAKPPKSAALPEPS